MPPKNIVVVKLVMLDQALYTKHASCSGDLAGIKKEYLELEVWNRFQNVPIEMKFSVHAAPDQQITKNPRKFAIH